MIKIIIPMLFVIYSSTTVADDELVSAPVSLYDLDFSVNSSDHSVGFIGRYDLRLGLHHRDQAMSYDLFNSGSGLAAKGVLKVPQEKRGTAPAKYHDALDSSATSKSRNNSRAQVVVISKPASKRDDRVQSGLSSIGNAKYDLLPSADVISQIGFDDKLRGDAKVTQDDELSLEADYSLTDSASIYVNHTQETHDSSLDTFIDGDERSKASSIGLRLNW